MSDKRWLTRVNSLVKRILKMHSPEKQLRSSRQVSFPTGQVILLRGISWWNDTTFEKLEKVFPARGLQVTRFSYNGPSQLIYQPIDIFKSMEIHITHLTEYVRHSSEDTPLYLIAHSFGGLVLANWLCSNHSSSEHLALVNKVAKVFFIASPLFPPESMLTFYHPILEQEVDYVFGDYEAHTLLKVCPNTIVLWATKDRIAPEKYASIKYQNLGEEGPLYEKCISSNHFDICNHKEVVDLILKHTDN